MDKIQNIESLFLHILPYSYLLTPLIFLIYWTKLKQEKSGIWLVIYALVFFALIFFEEILTPNKFLTRLYYQSYTFFEYLLFALFLWLAIKSSKTRKAIVALSIAFSVFQIIYFLTEKFKRIDSIPIGIESILILIYIFCFFYEQMSDLKEKHLSENFNFWFATGILIYLSASFFINILANVMDREEIDSYWFLSYIADIIKNIFLAIGLIVMARHSPDREKVKKNLPYLDMN